jgi:TRAP-type C4-dicarboxylate transport system permease small subunit
MNHLLNAFYRLLMGLSALSMLAAFASIMLGVGAREFGWNIQGLDAYAGYSIAAALFLALPGTLRHGDHIRVSLMLQRLSPGVRRIMEYWCLGVAVFLASALAWFAVRLVWVSYTTHDISPSADATPLWIPQITMALGCIGLALAFVQALVAHASKQDFYETPAEGELAKVE